MRSRDAPTSERQVLLGEPQRDSHGCRAPSGRRSARRARAAARATRWSTSPSQRRDGPACRRASAALRIRARFAPSVLEPLAVERRPGDARQLDRFEARSTVAGQPAHAVSAVISPTRSPGPSRAERHLDLHPPGRAAGSLPLLDEEHRRAGLAGLADLRAPGPTLMGLAVASSVPQRSSPARRRSARLRPARQVAARASASRR